MYGANGKDTITVGMLGIRFVVYPGDSNGTASVFECYLQAGARMAAAHRHDRFEETIYGLEGVTTWTVDGRALEVGPGEAMCVLRGQRHAFDNRGAIDAVFLAIATPGVGGIAYVREIGEVGSATAAQGRGPSDGVRSGRRTDPAGEDRVR